MSDYVIVVTRAAQKELASLPIEIISRINPSIEALAEEPRPTGCVKLKGKLNRWRIRVGDYRIIYSIDDGTFTINILAVRHRREAYER